MWIENPTFIDSCRVVATSIVSSFDSQKPFFYFFGIILLTIVVRVFLTSLKARRQSQQLQKTALKKLPKSIQLLSKKHNLSQNDIVLVKSDKLLAVTIGLFFPKILFSTGLLRLLSPKEVEAVFLHELHHYQKKHGLVLIMGEIISSALFFLPIIKDMVDHLKTTFEIQADQAVSTHQNSPKYLKQALVKLIQPNTNLIYPSFAAIPLKKLSTRVNFLTQNNKKPTTNKCHHKNTHKFIFSKIRVAVTILVLGGGLFLPHFSKDVVLAQIENDIPATSQCKLMNCVTTCLSQEIMNSQPTMLDQSL